VSNNTGHNGGRGACAGCHRLVNTLDVALYYQRRHIAHLAWSGVVPWPLSVTLGWSQTETGERA